MIILRNNWFSKKEEPKKKKGRKDAVGAAKIGAATSLGTLIGAMGGQNAIDESESKAWSRIKRKTPHISNYNSYATDYNLNNGSFSLFGGKPDPEKAKKAYDSIINSKNSHEKMTEAVENAVKKVKAGNNKRLLGYTLLGAGAGLAAGSLWASKKSKKKEKKFSDRPASWWAKKIEELEKTDPKSPRLEKFRQAYNYALYEEGKAAGATAEQKAAGKAAEEAMRGKSSGPKSSSSGASGSNYKNPFTKAWEDVYSEFNARETAESNRKMEELYRDSMKEAKKYESRAKAAERLSKRIEKNNAKEFKRNLGVAAGLAGVAAGIHIYNHYKNKKKENNNSKK